jgi:hypothetical protein
MEYEAKLSDIIASLPEVSGGFLYSPDKGIYSNQAGTAASDAVLQRVSQKLIKIVSMLSIHFNDTGGIRVTFNNLILFGMKIEEGNWLFLLHQPSLTPGMIKMTVQMALNIQPGDDPPEEQELPTEDDISESLADNDASAAALMASLMDSESELSKPLATIQEELATHIGPVAELIFEDSIKTWCANGPPSLEDLPELITMFEEEIDDEDDRKLFRENLKAYLLS